MNVEIVVPQVGEAISAARLTQWHKKEGDVIKKGEPLFSLDTDKAILDVEAFADGVLGKVLVAQDSDVQPGTVVGLLLTESEEGATPGRPTAPPVAEPSSEIPSRPTPEQRERKPSGDNRSLMISPKARRLARELGVDLAKLAEGREGQMITETDIRALGSAGADEKASIPQT